MSLYRLTNKLSHNELTESWTALDLKSQKSCFLKTINLNSKTFSLSFLKKTFTNSYKLQKEIQSFCISHPNKILSENGNIYIEYRMLNNKRWSVLNEDLLRTNLKTLLPKICFTIDLLHEHNLIHCDIKLENFHIDKSTNTIILTDLDFLSPNNSKSNGILKGTSNHISPQIIQNELIDKTADYYSLGVLLENIFKHDNTIEPLLKRLINQLKSEYRLNETNLLLELLYKNNLIDDINYEKYIKSLFTASILSKYRSSKSKNNIIRKLFSVDNHVIGINEEIIDLIQDNFKSNKLICLQYLRSIIEQCSLQKSGDYWLCSCNDESFNKLIIGNYSTIPKDKLVKSIKEQMEKGYIFLPYLTIKLLYSQEVCDQNPKIIEELARLANSINKLEEAKSYYELILQPSLWNYEEICFEHAAICIALNEYKTAERTINRFYKTKPKNELKLKFECLKALILIRKGELINAEELLHFLLKEAVSNKYPYPQVLTYYYYSILNWYKGDMSKAIYFAKNCEKLAKKYHFTSLENSAQINLSFFNAESGNYSEALKYGNRANKNINTVENFNKKQSLLNNLFYAAVRTGKYKEAQKYLHQSIAKGHQVLDFNKNVLYFLSKSFLEINKGNYQKAQYILSSTLHSFNVNGIKKNEGKIYQNLTEVSVYLDDQKRFLNYFNKAKILFDSLKDNIAVKELELLSIINEYLNHFKTPKQDVLKKLSDELLKKKSLYFGMLAKFYIYLISIENNIPLEFKEKDCDYQITADVPLFNALITIEENIYKKNTNTEIISVLKSIAQIFQKVKNKFLYAYIMRIIGLKYIEESNYKLANKFLTVSKEMYISIGNDNAANAIEVKLSSFTIPDEDNAKNKTIKEISDILTNIHDYGNCLQQILHFALDQTGAERAVLLLKRPDSHDLKVEAQINCDDSSLLDIHSYSTSISVRSFEYNEPMIIDNALNDNSLNNYKSILKHNIMSVISIPLKKDNNILGVLYLDHHSIPALFSKTDITFSFTLANLLSLLISTSGLVQNLKTKNKELVSELNRVSGKNRFITQDKIFNVLFERLPTVAKSNASVLLIGESGTGKEIIAEMIHTLSNRASKPLIKINCTAIPDNLIESELFGIEDNVATGVKGRDGKFVAGDDGTLFIDEIGDMPLSFQAKILRAIEYQEFEKVGSNRTIRTDVRFIYATNKDLKKLIREHKFRDDLFYRINTIPIIIPPLRERKGDISLLIEYFISLYSVADNGPRLSSEVIVLFENYNWPGNVRELKNIIERLCLLYSGKIVTLHNIPLDIKESIKLNEFQNIPDIVEKTNIIEALEKNNWVESKAAKVLKIPLSTFRRRIIKYSIKQSKK